METREKLNLCLRCTDHTSLGQGDTTGSVRRFVERAMGLELLPAAICVYPSMVESVGVSLGESPVAIAAVCGAFPSGQTYIEVKLLEVAMAIENGAEEIDMVMDIGALLEGNYDIARSELEVVKEEIGDDALFKVILETGTLVSPELIHRATLVACEAGADFVKTSTGKTPIGATPAAVEVMCRAVKEYFAKTGRRVGIKCSGGISTPEQALTYYDVVERELGAEWLCPALFRLGSSKLLLSQCK